MRDRIRERTLSVVAVIGLCSVTSRSNGGNNVLAFAPSCGRRSARTATNAANGRRQDRRGGASSVARGGLSMVGTKRARPTTSSGPIPPPNAKDDDDDDGGGAEEERHRDASSKPKIKFDLLPDFMQKDPLLVTKQKWAEKTRPTEIISEGGASSASKRQKSEMMAMSAASIVFAIGVVYALASSTPEMIISVDPSDFSNGGGLESSESAVRDLFREGNAERLEIATRNIVGTVLPQSAEDVISVSIGEGIAGVIGAFATWLLGTILNFKSDGDYIVLAPMNDAAMRGMESTTAATTTRRGYANSGRMMGGSGGDVDSLVSGAVADGDYFLTRAAAQPLLEALGIPIFFASVASVLIATVPYEAVKISSQKRRNEVEEQVLLNMLLEEEENRRKDMNAVDKVSNNIFDFIQRLNVRASMDDIAMDDYIMDGVTDVNIPERKEQPGNVPALDYVELFADITKWLEYDVLISNYRGILSMPNGQMLSTGWESAIFG